MKDTPQGEKEGVLITGNVFKDYPLDDLVWDNILTGKYPGVSFGGHNSNFDFKYEKGMSPTKILKGIEGYEFSLVPGMGNQEATMQEINYFAKGSKNLKKAYEKDGAHVHAEEPLGLHNHPEIENIVQGEVRNLHERINRLSDRLYDSLDDSPESIPLKSKIKEEKHNHESDIIKLQEVKNMNTEEQRLEAEKLKDEEAAKEEAAKEEAEKEKVAEEKAKAEKEAKDAEAEEAEKEAAEKEEAAKEEGKSFEQLKEDMVEGKA
ncbi:MAG: hypothetical protein IIB81_05075, partial [Nanoarchaeota archaeon]|nr:hypothetical protein [Nanoarchaeota archaeon]